MLKTVSGARSFVCCALGAPAGNARLSPGFGTPIGFQLFGFDHKLLAAPVHEDVNAKADVVNAARANTARRRRTAKTERVAASTKDAPCRCAPDDIDFPPCIKDVG